MKGASSNVKDGIEMGRTEGVYSNDYLHDLQVMVALTTSGAAAAASIVYLAHNGNPNTNWNAICQQFNDFCQRVSGAVVASFITALIFVFLVVLSAVALRRN